MSKWFQRDLSRQRLVGQRHASQRARSRRLVTLGLFWLGAACGPLIGLGVGDAASPGDPRDGKTLSGDRPAGDAAEDPDDSGGDVCIPQCQNRCGGANGCGSDCPDNCVLPDTCGGGGTQHVCGFVPHMPDSATRYCSNGVSVIACPATDSSAGQDGDYLRHSPAYQTVGTDTVLDLVTGLLWTQSSSSPISYAQADTNCQGSNLGGHNDWHLPTRVELVSLFDLGRTVGGSIDGSVFSLSASTVWTETPFLPLADNVWVVQFSLGSDAQVLNLPKTDVTSVALCVRGAATSVLASGDFRLVVDGIEDQATGLIWETEHHGSETWWQALRHCEDLVTNGGTVDDWRVPTLKEALTLIDDGSWSPAVNATFFSGTPQEGELWSSTPVVGSPDMIHSIFLWAGKTTVHGAAGHIGVRCVRDRP